MEVLPRRTVIADQRFVPSAATYATRGRGLGMEGQTIDVARRLIPTRKQLWSCLALLPLLAALGLVFVTTLRCPLKDDTAWLLYVTQQWLAGRHLYVDLIEVNPPMIVWILALPTALATTLGISA